MTALARSPQPLIVEPGHAQAYLQELGIPVSAVYQAVERGELRAADIDRFHPKGAAGLTRWITVVGDLRRSLDATGRWRTDNRKNRPTCERVDKKVVVSVVGADLETGRTESSLGPRADHKRGAATAEAMRDQLELIEIAAVLSSGSVPSLGEPAPGGQWFVLYHRADDGVRLEVSKAAGLDAYGQFEGWLVRVLLKPWMPSADSNKRPSDVGGGDVDFTVVPAAS